MNDIHSNVLPINKGVQQDSDTYVEAVRNSKASWRKCYKIQTYMLRQRETAREAGDSVIKNKNVCSDGEKQQGRLETVIQST